MCTWLLTLWVSWTSGLGVFVITSWPVAVIWSQMERWGWSPGLLAADGRSEPGPPRAPGSRHAARVPRNTQRRWWCCSGSGRGKCACSSHKVQIGFYLLRNVSARLRTRTSDINSVKICVTVCQEKLVSLTEYFPLLSWTGGDKLSHQFNLPDLMMILTFSLFFCILFEFKLKLNTFL